MAEGTQQGAINAAFPGPPPFYKSFTAENLEKLQQFIKPSTDEATSQTRSAEPHLLSITDFTSVPSDIRNLIPPAPPWDGKYRSFGEELNVNPPPSNAPTIPTRENLLNLTDRLMQQFQRYVQIMATNPSGELWVPQWEEIKKTFEQVHGVINEYRPHEARENLIIRYEDQIAQVSEESERVKDSIEKARRTLENLGKVGLADTQTFVDGQEDTATGKKAVVKNKNGQPRTKTQLMWKIIEEEVGKA